MSALARRYVVVENAIHSIVKGLTWKDVSPPPLPCPARMTPLVRSKTPGNPAKTRKPPRADRWNQSANEPSPKVRGAPVARSDLGIWNQSANAPVARSDLGIWNQSANAPSPKVRGAPVARSDLGLSIGADCVPIGCGTAVQRGQVPRSEATLSAMGRNPKRPQSPWVAVRRSDQFDVATERSPNVRLDPTRSSSNAPRAES
jgi:hypothetical protein